MTKALSAMAAAVALSLPASALASNLNDWSIGVSYANDFTETGSIITADIRKNLSASIYTTLSAGQVQFQGGDWYLNPVDHPDCQGYFSAGSSEVSYDCGDEYSKENEYKTSTGVAIQSLGFESVISGGLSYYASVGLGVAFSPDDNEEDPYNPINSSLLGQAETGLLYRTQDHLRFSAGIRHLSTIKDFGNGIDAFSVSAAFEF